MHLKPRWICLLLFGVLGLLPAVAQAHFIWLVQDTDDSGQILHLYFEEAAEPSEAYILERVADAEVQQVTAKGDTKTYTFSKGEDSLIAKIPQAPKQSMFFLQRDLGVMTRGEDSFLLKYYAKTGPGVGSKAWEKNDCSEHLAFNLVPKAKGKQIQITALYQGKPVEDAQVVVIGPGMNDFEAQTDKNGQVTFPRAGNGVYSIRARMIEEKSGKSGDDEYKTTRHYSTLALKVGGAKSMVTQVSYPKLPENVTSFGAAISGDALYLYGGHTGRAHHYYKEAQAHTLRRLNLKKPAGWESLGHGPGLQGLAMVAHNGKLYRIGGFTANNTEEEDRDLHSQATVACFDPQTKTWTEMTPLPEPRSSFDAAVLGDKIYVVGGWSMQGDEEAQWHTTAYSLDLSQPDPQWTELATPPFQRRALSVAAYQGKIYAIGGMQSEGGPTTRVDVYDPKSDSWSEGPSLQGEGMEGFGSSAFAVGDKLYVSTYEGNLQRLSKDGKSWEIAKELENARFFHRMLPFSDSQLLTVGGANMSIGKFEEIEIIDVKK
ncbi:N-acetylneuraminic acid mutarotase [Planctomycetales bacterium 10988]|nr:N-acetylneuraminic acid mutarotase [Planctomycetales bacterium 10988]